MKPKEKPSREVTPNHLTSAPAENQKPDFCKALLGGMLCGLVVGGADIKDVREAVQWWSRNSKGWIHFASFAAKEKAAKNDA